MALRFQLERPAKWATSLVGLTVLGDLALGYQSFATLAFFRTATDGSLTDADLMLAGETLDSQALVVSIGYLVAFVLSVIASGIWIYRASWNAGQLQPSVNRITPGWAVGWYFVPFMALWKPLQAMKECWNSSADPQGDMDRGMPGLMTGWWTTWVVTSLWSSFSTRRWNKADTIEEMRNLCWGDIVMTPVSIASAILFILLIQRLTQMQAQHLLSAE
jgi:hypothetical protein